MATFSPSALTQADGEYEGFIAIMDGDAFFAPPLTVVFAVVVFTIFACNCSHRLLSHLVTSQLNPWFRNLNLIAKAKILFGPNSSTAFRPRLKPIA